MKTMLCLSAAALLIAGLASTTALATGADTVLVTPGLGRTDIVRHDLDGTNQEFSQVRVDFAPGVAAPAHSHPGVEIAHALSGTMEYRLEGKPPVILKAGESLYIPAGTIHSVRNVGNGPASELATYLVEKGKPVLQLAK